MLNNNSLGDRLNAVKKGNPIPKPPMQPQSVYDKKVSQSQVNIPIKDFLISKLLQIIDVFLASFIYGFAIKTIFSLEWSLFGSFAVGFLLNHAITVWPKLFKNIFKKSN